MRNLLPLLLFIIVFTPPFESDASSTKHGGFRILEGLGPSEVAAMEGSPSPDPVLSGNQNLSPNPSPLISHRGGKLSPHLAPAPADSPKDRLKDEVGTCKASSNQCSDRKSMIACLVHSATAQQELYLVVQNSGQNTLNVTVTGLPEYLETELLQHQVKKIRISTFPGKGATIALNAGDGDCVIRVEGAASKGNLPHLFPYHASLMTPINGLYLSFLAAAVVGGAWACCKRRKKGVQQLDGVPYQELEMGQPELPPSDGGGETVEGWDEGWNDDDWDEESATTKPPNENHAEKNQISSNGTGWEDDWED